MKNWSEKGLSPFTSDGWKRDLNRAIERDQLYMMYQPKFKGTEIVGYEALCRWEHPLYGLIPPNLFIPESEETGYILDIGRFAVQSACELISHMMEVGITVSIAVNVSPLQLRGGNGSDFIKFVKATTHELEVARNKLIIEVTEGHEIDRDDVLSTLNDIKSHGFSLSLDDFGTGYSAYSVFNKLNIDQLKVDRCFVDSIGTAKGDIIIESIIRLGWDLGMEVVIEGVETQVQNEFLSQYPNLIIQGYYLSPPLRLESILKSLCG